MRPDLPSRFTYRSIDVSTALGPHDVMLYGLFIVSSPGITVTLPPPQEALDGAECLIVNDAADSATVASSEGFPNSLDTITLAAGAAVFLYCAQTSGTAYRWASVGANPA
jgi:hypothetical protein